VTQTHIDLNFADGVYRCALGLAQIHELQTKCGVGIGGLYARVMQGRLADDTTVGHPAFAAFHVDDLRETMRQALVGGALALVDGKESKVGDLRANELVERYFDRLPMAEQWNFAAAILSAKIVGHEPAEGENIGSAEKKSSTTDGSTTPPP